jgi:hypothetical protein
MRTLLIAALAVVIVGAGVSAAFVTGSRQPGPQQQTSTFQPSATTVSVSQISTMTITVNASDPYAGCAYNSTTYEEGYSLTVHYSSPTPTIGDTECISGDIEDASGVPVPANQSFDFSLTFTVTASNGTIVMNSVPCAPSGTVLPGEGPAQGFACGDYWGTEGLTPGIYHITVVGTHSGQGVANPVTVTNEVNVTLSAAASSATP